MFARRKKNKSGSVSVQIIDKTYGYKVIKTVGSSKNTEEIKNLVAEARYIVEISDGQQSELFPLQSQEETAIENFVAGLSNPQVHFLCWVSRCGRLLK
jgi:hypothetical protein